MMPTEKRFWDDELGLPEEVRETMRTLSYDLAELLNTEDEIRQAEAELELLYAKLEKLRKEIGIDLYAELERSARYKTTLIP
jgi:hypothetical protein